ncbi:MAG: hypothetical protein KA369_24100 [Spirochaetes bacterium]|nr:hypothetical protein [Spirochaetota bacterium]
MKKLFILTFFISAIIIFLAIFIVTDNAFAVYKFREYSVYSIHCIGAGPRHEGKGDTSVVVPLHSAEDTEKHALHVAHSRSLKNCKAEKNVVSFK